MKSFLLLKLMLTAAVVELSTGWVEWFIAVRLCVLFSFLDDHSGRGEAMDCMYTC